MYKKSVQGVPNIENNTTELYFIHIRSIDVK